MGAITPIAPLWSGLASQIWTFEGFVA